MESDIYADEDLMKEIDLILNENVLNHAETDFDNATNATEKLKKYLIDAKKLRFEAQQHRDPYASAKLGAYVQQYESYLLLLESGAKSEIDLTALPLPYDIKINRALVEENEEGKASADILIKLIESYKNAALISKDQSDFKSAKQHFLTALDLKSKLSLIQNNKGAAVLKKDLPNPPETPKKILFRESDENMSIIEQLNAQTENLAKRKKLYSANASLTKILDRLLEDTAHTAETVQAAIRENESMPKIKVTVVKLAQRTESERKLNSDVPNGILNVKIGKFVFDNAPSMLKMTKSFKISLLFPKNDDLFNPTVIQTREQNLQKNAKQKRAVLNFDQIFDIKIETRPQNSEKVVLSKMNLILTKDTLFQRAVAVAAAEVRLTSLSEKAEISKNVTFLNDNSEKIGKLALVLKTRKPLSKLSKAKQAAAKAENFKYLSLKGPPAKTKDAGEAQTQRQTQPKPKGKDFIKPKTPSPAEGEVPFPKGLPLELEIDPFVLKHYISNDVLEHIKTSTNAKIQKHIASGKLPPDALCERLKEATALLAALESQVAEGAIDLAAYLGSVRRSLAVLTLLAEYLREKGRAEEAGEVRVCVSLMESELEGARNL